MEFEYAILDFIRDTMTCPFMDGVMKFITSFGNAGWFWIVLGLVLAFIPKTRKIGLTICLALIINLIVCNLALKPLIARERPYVLANIVPIIGEQSDYSFPSGHTSASFAAAFALFLYNKKWYGISALAFATLIAFTRLYLYVHFPTDILGGIAVGVIAAVGAYYAVGWIYKKLSLKKKVS